MNHWINHEAVCRTAPATPGLLNIYYNGLNKIKNILKKLLLYNLKSCSKHYYGKKKNNWLWLFLKSVFRINLVLSEVLNPCQFAIGYFYDLHLKQFIFSLDYKRACLVLEFDRNMLIGLVFQWAPGSPSCPGVPDKKDKSGTIVLSKNKATKMALLRSILWVFLTIYIFLLWWKLPCA